MKRHFFLFSLIIGLSLAIFSHQVWSQPEGVLIAVEAASEPIRIVVISDLNSQYGSTEYEPEVKNAIALIPKLKPDLVLSGGDMVAGQKRDLTESQIRAMWSGFDQHIGKPLRDAKIPMGFTMGNHDASSALSPEGNYIFNRDRAIASQYWQDPNHDSGLNFVDKGNFPFYYSFSQNDIFYLVWDASTARITPTQLAWVERSLASPEAQNAKLRIAIGHLPLYGVAIGRDKPGEVLHSPEQLRSLLEKYNVHTYISGHQHVYYPGHRGKLDLLHAGVLGAGPRQLVNSDLPPNKTMTILDINPTTAAIDYTTYDMRTMELIDQQNLPRLIVGHNGWVLRRDIEKTDLTPQEQALIN